MLWLLNEAPDDGRVPIIIRYDSQYAANIAQGLTLPRANEELGHKVRELTESVERKRNILWTHVYGHSGEHDNELADRAADMGARGMVSDHSRRWNEPPPPIPELPEEGEKDWCRKCGQRILCSEIKCHFRRCTVEGEWYIPEGKGKCRKCMGLIPLHQRTQHEKICRGSVEANHTCAKYGMVFAVDPAAPPGRSRAKRVHETSCRGDDQARAKATAKAKASGPSGPQAKAKSIALRRPAAAGSTVMRRPAGHR